MVSIDMLVNSISLLAVSVAIIFATHEYIIKAKGAAARIMFSIVGVFFFLSLYKLLIFLKISKLFFISTNLTEVAFIVAIGFMIKLSHDVYLASGNFSGTQNIPPGIGSSLQADHDEPI